MRSRSDHPEWVGIRILLDLPGLKAGSERPSARDGVEEADHAAPPRFLRQKSLSLPQGSNGGNRESGCRFLFAREGKLLEDVSLGEIERDGEEAFSDAAALAEDLGLT